MFASLRLFYWLITKLNLVVLMSKSKQRCTWCVGNKLYESYHDKDWGVPVHDDQLLFEMLILEGAQAGLSWITVLQKRENYRKAFSKFDYRKIAKYTDKKLEKLLENPGIIRNRLKVFSTRNNARCFLEVQNEFDSFDNYIWRFVDGKTIQNKFKTTKQVPASTKQSDAMSKDLKKRGFKFIGTTICYAYMQSVGMVNDHTTDCFRHSQLKKRR